jgi:excisionase family DNA binding protein
MSNIEAIEQEEFIGTGTASRLAGTSPQTIRAWIRQHRLEAARPGRRFLVSARSLRAALEPVGKQDEE